MKKFITLFITIILTLSTLSLFGCGKGKDYHFKNMFDRTYEFDSVEVYIVNKNYSLDSKTVNEAKEEATTTYADKIALAKTEHENDEYYFYDNNGEACYKLNNGDEKNLSYKEIKDQSGKIYYDNPKFSEDSPELVLDRQSGNLSWFKANYYETLDMEYYSENLSTTITVQVQILVQYKVKS